MADYRLIGTEKLKDTDCETIVATQPAAPGHYVVYAFKERDHIKVPVLLWGILRDGVPLPITLGGVWDGVSNANNFLLHPDGYCSTFDQSWESLDDAITDMRERDRG